MGKLGVLSFAALLLATGCTAGRLAVRNSGGPHRFQPLLEDAPLEIGSEGWTSRWIAAPIAFDELLPSWNVDLSGSAAFRVELRTARGTQGPPTPWLDLGGWGRWPETDRAPTTCEAGRVEVDILKLGSFHDRLQLRLRVRGLQARQELVLQRLDANFSRSDVLAGGWTIAPPAPGPIALAVPQRRQADESPELAARICSPTSVAMVLAYWGIERPTAEVAAMAYDAEHDIYGNWNRASGTAHLFGLAGSLYRLNDWAEARLFLEQGLPLVISIGVEPGQLTGAPYESTAGHLIVLSGFDGAGHALVMDPAVAPPERGPLKYALDELEQCWLRRGGFAYVLAPANGIGPR